MSMVGKPYKESEMKIELPKSFWRVLENGIYKELHRRKLLTNAELNHLLKIK